MKIFIVGIVLEAHAGKCKGDIWEARAVFENEGESLNFWRNELQEHENAIIVPIDLGIRYNQKVRNKYTPYYIVDKVPLEEVENEPEKSKETSEESEGTT